MYGQHFQQSMNQPDMVANPARGQLNKEKLYFPCPRSRLRIWSRETGSEVPSRVGLRKLTPRDAPPCVCLPLSLFDLIDVPLSLLLHFMPLCGALVVLVLALSSYLGCLALLTYHVYCCLSCPMRIICGCPGLFRFCFLVFPS